MNMSKYRHELHTQWSPDELAALLSQLGQLGSYVFKPLIDDETDIDDAVDALDTHVEKCAVAMLQMWTALVPPDVSQSSCLCKDIPCLHTSLETDVMLKALMQ